MNKHLAVLTVLATFIGGVSYAGSKSTAHTAPGYTDNGNKIDAFEVSVGTTTPVLIHSGLSKHRELMIQPDINYDLYLATHTNFTATTGARWKVPAGGAWTTNAYPEKIYGLYESDAGAGGDVLGEVEYDTTDKY